LKIIEPKGVLADSRQANSSRSSAKWVQSGNGQTRFRQKREQNFVLLKNASTIAPSQHYAALSEKR